LSKAATPSEGWEPRWARSLYGRVARVYDAIRPLWSSSEAEAKLDALFAERIGPSTRVLELAPGTGINVERLFRRSPKFGSYLGIDVSSAMLDRARVAARNDSRVTLQLGDATDLSGLAGSFGFIVCTWLLSHLEHPERTVRDALEHLEPGGTAAFLFFIRPDNPVIRALVSLFVRSFRGAFVDAEAISSLPHLEVMNRCGGGYATLAVFHRPREASLGSSPQPERAV
jgi:ubiquinone/menaquinone biosynthesis C-methylase UbiE